MQVATELAPHFADGAAFVSLDSLKDPAQVAGAVAQALQVTEMPGQSIEASSAPIPAQEAASTGPG